MNSFTWASDIFTNTRHYKRRAVNMAPHYTQVTAFQWRLGRRKSDARLEMLQTLKLITNWAM